MGFLDKLLKGAVDAIDDAVQKNTGSKSGLGDLLDQAMTLKDQALGGSSSASSSSGSSAGSGITIPAPKPDVQVTGMVYGSGVDTPYSFMISDDFVEFDSGAAEVDYSAVYAPDFDRESGRDPYEMNESSCFVLMYDAEDEVIDALQKFRNGTRPGNTMLIEPVSNLGEKIFCKLKMKLRTQILYCYGMDRGASTKNTYFGVSYPSKVMGTPLETRLIQEVDKAIKTYREG